MLKYPFPGGKIKVRDMIPLIADALYPDDDRESAIRRVRQAIKDGWKAKKNPLSPEKVLYDKDFFKWALKRWPQLLERIEGVPQRVKVTGALQFGYSIDAHNINDPADLEVLVHSYLDDRLSAEERTGDELADLKRAFVKAEQQCKELLKETDGIIAKCGTLESRLADFERVAKERSEKCSESGKKKKGCKHESW